VFSSLPTTRTGRADGVPSSRHADDSRDGDGQDRRNSFANPPVLGEDESPAKKLALQRENESATTLAKGGYDVEQNPTVLGDKNPDYLVNGKIFDCYAPTTSNIRNIADRVETKVVRRQADRIVLNMTDSYRKANTPTPTSP
jgi:hypothetical protein